MRVAMREEIKALIGKLDEKNERLDEHKADLRELLAGAEGMGLRRDALKSALKLRKLEPTKLTAWFVTFDRVVETIGLRDQLDMETVIRAADEAFERAMAQKNEDDEEA